MLPAAVLALAKGVLKMMVVSQAKLPAMLSALAVAAIGAWAAWNVAPVAPVRAEPVRAKTAAVQPAPVQGQAAQAQAAPAPAAPRPQAAPEPAWKAEFRKAYGLKPGEHVKRIAPPYPASRTDYFKDRFRRDAGTIPFDEHFTVVSWKDNWAPPELARHTLPVKPNEGIALDRLLDMTAGISRTRLRGLDDVLKLPVTGDFVVRAGSTPEQIVAQLQKLLATESSGGPKSTCHGHSAASWPFTWEKTDQAETLKREAGV